MAIHNYATGTNLWISAAATLLLLLLLAPLVSTQCPADNGEDNWLPYRDACYKYYNQSEFWYTAEMTCKEAGGHLVSIANDQENRLVGKMSLCRDAWTGMYATDLSRLSEPAGYAWTDGSKDAAQYSRHNFTEKPSIHTPLIKSKGLNWYNSLYHERHPFVCEVPAKSGGEQKKECPSSMKLYQGHCYLLSSFESNFVEANFFCQNRSAQLTSVLHEGELRFLTTLDLGEDECQLQAIWLGLIKLNPCYPDQGGREMCYQWTDFSGKHANFPSWADDQPQATASPSPSSSDTAAASTGKDKDRESCVVISGDQMSSADCNTRHHFVCKAPAGSLTGDAWKRLDEPTRPRPAGSNETGRAAAAATVLEAAEAAAAATVAPATTPDPTTTSNSSEFSLPTEAITEVEMTTMKTKTAAATQPPSTVAPTTVASETGPKGLSELSEFGPIADDTEHIRYRKEISSANKDPEDRFPSLEDSGEPAKKKQQQQPQQKKQQPKPAAPTEATINKQPTQTMSPEMAAALAAPKPTNGPREPVDEHPLETEAFLSTK